MAPPTKITYFYKKVENRTQHQNTHESTLLQKGTVLHKMCSASISQFPPLDKLVVYDYSFSGVTPVIECFTTKNQPKIWEKWNNFPDVTSPEKSGHFRKNDKNNAQHQITHWFTVL